MIVARSLPCTDSRVSKRCRSATWAPRSTIGERTGRLPVRIVSSITTMMNVEELAFEIEQSTDARGVLHKSQTTARMAEDLK
jgi:hypothetical protein